MMATPPDLAGSVKETARWMAYLSRADEDEDAKGAVAEKCRRDLERVLACAAASDKNSQAVRVAARTLCFVITGDEWRSMLMIGETETWNVTVADAEESRLVRCLVLLFVALRTPTALTDAEMKDLEPDSLVRGRALASAYAYACTSLGVPTNGTREPSKRNTE